MKTKQTKTKVVTWESNTFYPNNNGVTKSVSQSWWTNFNSSLYDRLMQIKQGKS